MRSRQLSAPHTAHITPLLSRPANSGRDRTRRWVPRSRGDTGGDELDLVERFVTRLFGKKALEDQEPMGMRRLSEADAPEMWPATTTEWAAPVPGDAGEAAALRPLLAKTQLERAPLRLAYDSKRDEWSAEALVSAAATYGATLVVAETKGGAVFGGYNPRGFLGLGEERDSIAAFLFTFPRGLPSRTSSESSSAAGAASAEVIKVPKVGGASLAVLDGPDRIQFGAEGLTLLARGKERSAKCRLGTYYARTPQGGRSLFAEGEDLKGAEVVGVRAYVAVGGPEEWKLDGIVWKSSKG